MSSVKNVNFIEQNAQADLATVNLIAAPWRISAPGLRHRHPGGPWRPSTPVR
jgi:hypothetical protein